LACDIVFVTLLLTDRSIASYQEIFWLIPVEDKFEVGHPWNRQYYSLHNTHVCHSAQQTKQHTSNIKAAHYFHLAGQN